MASMTLSLVTSSPKLMLQPKVLNDALTQRLAALNNAERTLRNDLGMTVVFTKLAGQVPQIAIQYEAGQMTRVLNRMTSRSKIDDGDCFIVSGGFEGVTVLWAVPK